MNRALNIAFTLTIVTFWAAMNSALIEREMEIRTLGLYQRGVTHYLGKDLHRERWLGIYRANRKIGYTGFVLRKLFEDQGVRHHMKIETRIAVGIADLLGDQGIFHGLKKWVGQGKPTYISVKGSMFADIGMIPEQLAVDIRFESHRIHISGQRSGDSFLVSAMAGGRKILEEKFPLREFVLSNGLAPDLPIAGFKEGQTYKVPVFDPVFQTTALATVLVKGRGTRRVSGLKVDCYQLETRFHGLTFQSWVTSDGETVRQEIPPLGLTLSRESRDQARQGFYPGE